jgi:hypothetical protein
MYPISGCFVTFSLSYGGLMAYYREKQVVGPAGLHA